LWTSAVSVDPAEWRRGYVSALTGGVTEAGVFPTGGDDPRVQVALETEVGRRYREFARALYRVDASPVGEDGRFSVRVGDLRFTNPFTDDALFQLRIDVGPDFRAEGHGFASGSVPPDP
jgi:hypothetical protein